MIGLKGVIITNLTRETQCKFIKALQPVGDSLWLAVVMMGEPEQCLAAYTAIAKVPSPSTRSLQVHCYSCVSTQHQMVFNEVDDVVVEFPYTRKRYGFLVGQQGFQIIKRISAETQVCPPHASCLCIVHTCALPLLRLYFYAIPTPASSLRTHNTH